jgi:hypothetical protein
MLPRFRWLHITELKIVPDRMKGVRIWKEYSYYAFFLYFQIKISFLFPYPGIHSEDKDDRSEKWTWHIYQVSTDSVPAASPPRRLYGVINRYLIKKSNSTNYSYYIAHGLILQQKAIRRDAKYFTSLRWSNQVGGDAWDPVLRGEKTNAYKAFVGKFSGNRPLERPRRKWENNIYLKDIEPEMWNRIIWFRIQISGEILWILDSTKYCKFCDLLSNHQIVKKHLTP